MHGAIASIGLGDYYRLRTAPAATAVVGGEALEGFDQPAVQARFVRDAGGGAREAELLIEGMRCAACAWLVEHALGRTPGVVSASVNYSTRRARVRWAGASLSLSAMLAAIRSVGYAAWPYEEGRIALVESRERRTLLRRFWVAGLGMMQVMMYAFPAYVAGDGDITADAGSLMHWAAFVLTLPVVAYSAAPFFRGAWRDLRLARLGMDVPVSLGIAVAFLASAWSTVSAQGAVYFDSVTMFVFLLLGGRYLELVARARAGLALQHLARLQPRIAERLRSGEGFAIDCVAATSLVPGDRVLVRSGQTVPADGDLEGGDASVSEAWLSGESRTVFKRAGDALVGGSINAGRALVLLVRRVGAETTLSSIQAMMERALDERPAWAAASERAAGLFVAVVLASAAVAAFAWWQWEPSRALWIAVSILVVTCPCALALGTPTALTVASGAMARRNLVVTRAGAIERLAGITDFVFDKTGTLTDGQARLLDVVPLGREDEPSCRALAASLAQASSHPLDRAFVALEAAAADVQDHCNHAGDGVEARIDGRRLRLGRAEFVRALHGLATPEPGIDRALTTVWLADESGWIAAFGVGDALRPGAREAVERLRRGGVALHLLSGDAFHVVERVAMDLGIAEFEAGATPQRKLDSVRALQAHGARVAMVGDGINDAPVLAQADVSIAMGGGADLAQVRADAILLSDSIADLAAATVIARRARRVIRQNLAWALAYNVLAIPLAFAGLVTPLVAGVAMASSSLLVVANALRLAR